MTSCRSIKSDEPKKTVFNVQIDITSMKQDRRKMVDVLVVDYGWTWMKDLGEIIEKG